MVEMYNFLTLGQGKVIISNGLTSSDIIQVLTNDVIGLTSINPCAFLDYLIIIDHDGSWDQIYNPSFLNEQRVLSSFGPRRKLWI